MKDNQDLPTKIPVLALRFSPDLVLDMMSGPGCGAAVRRMVSRREAEERFSLVSRIGTCDIPLD